MFARSLAAVAALFLLAGCASTESLETLRQTQAQGDAYQKALAASYRDYAEQTAAAEAWQTSDYFAKKGLLAANSADVGPEEPQRWGLPEEKLGEFAAAREQLMKALVANRSLQPEMSASATLAYDRWLVAEHGGTNAHEEQVVFNDILTKLTEVHAEDPTGLPTTTIPPEKSKASILYFPLNVDHLGDSALGALHALSRELKASKTAVHIIVNGHADRSGSEEYNMDLSNRRAQFVVKQLVKAGVSRKLIQYFAFGESDPAVPTADGVPEPKNRRAEIFIE